jgi:D-aspartate ligase
MSAMIDAILLGSQETALGVTRSLGRRGVRVTVSGPADGIALRSRYCAAAFVFPDAAHSAASWGEWLLGREGERLAGAVLLAACDEGLEFIARHYDALGARYRLDMRGPELHLALLDKRRTLELGRSAGVATPNFWNVTEEADLQRALETLRFPVLVKPITSHVFRKVFGHKHFIARDADELVRNAHRAFEAGQAFMLCELITGPDSLLSSYYTYLTPQGEALFHFTKRVLRRYPLNEGGATYHLTEWLPRTAEAGERFLRGIGFEGLGNVEFKLDRRDGELKLIECNARFTAAQALVGHAGVDTAWLVYARAAGIEPPRIAGFREGLCLWYPMSDLRAFRELRRTGRLSLRAWMRSLARPKIGAYFDRSDMRPAFVEAGKHLREVLGGRVSRIFKRNTAQAPAVLRPSK